MTRLGLFAFGISTWIAACGARQLAPPATHHLPASADDDDVRAKPEPPKPSVGPACTTAGLLVLAKPNVVDMVCEDEFRQCSGEVTIEIHNCVRHRLGVGELHLEHGDGVYSYSYGNLDADLAYRDLWTKEIQLRRTGTWTVSISALEVERSDDALNVGPMTTQLTVNNSARERAVAECSACNGHWGRHGIMGIEDCNCRNSDGGEKCNDGLDCEGMCISRPDGKGFRCAEFVFEWSCYSYKPEGWSKLPATKRRNAPLVCVD